MSSSGSPTITIAAPPNTAGVASEILGSMAAESGVITDYNQGSQIRTIAESVGAVVEEQGIWSQALAFQALVYSALSLFNIFPSAAVPASGIVTFSTSNSGPNPPASQNIPIPAGTLIQTNGGVQFQTTAAVTISVGTGSITVPVAALNAGTAGNVPAASITQIISGLVYPLFITNAAPTSGGANAPSVANSLALFAAQIAAIGLSSPVAIANAAYGVSYGAENVQFSTLFEPWIAAGSGAGSGTAGWTLYIDNGTGTASSGLINAVIAKLNGGTVSGASNASGAIGYRDAGVPYVVDAVTPTYAYVSVSASVVSGASVSLTSGAIAAAVSGYFSLPFGASAERANIDAVVGNATQGNLTALAIALSASSGSFSDTPTVSTAVTGRVILGWLEQVYM